MKHALALALRGRGHVSPNPMVGCVIVKKGKVVGQGYHARFGGPHAEVVALQKAGRLARGATMYLTLEPCTHWGKTPPCLPNVVRSGVKTVYIAMKDPNPRVAGQGIKGLKKAGIRTFVGLEGEAAEALNRPFMIGITKKRPYTILKLAMTLDGKTATRTGDSKWISSPESRKKVHTLRSQVDAVLVGAQTAVKDNPKLTSHGQGKNPLRIVLDPKLRTPVRLKIYTDGEAPTMIITSNRVSKSRFRAYEKQGVQILTNSLKNGSFELKELMKNLFKINVGQLLIEGGEKTAKTFFDQNLIDETLFFIAPKLIGDHSKMTQAKIFHGPDLVIHERVR
jgi:diaminohydroxyphosphoribosylaminopyrimidine deaminase/5-amino-6-(5-phosphoribosylamino)uracil reductase